MKKSKVLSIVISGLLVVSMAFILSACGGSEKKEETPQTPVVSSGSSQAGTSKSADSEERKAIIKKGKIVVGITDFAPMDYQENGEWVGFDADLARKYAESLGVDIEFIEIDWDNKILELNAGTVDCIWNGMTLTPEVESAMECTEPYAINAQVVVMPKDKLDQFKDKESMKDLSFAVEAGSSGEEVGKDEGLKVNAVQNQAAALMEVAAGTSEACIIDKTMADAMTGEGTSYPDLAYAVSLSEEEYVVGFREASGLAEELNRLFVDWKADGTMKSISEKYDNAVSLVD